MIVMFIFLRYNTNIKSTQKDEGAQTARPEGARWCDNRESGVTPEQSCCRIDGAALHARLCPGSHWVKNPRRRSGAVMSEPEDLPLSGNQSVATAT